ncbi:MAG TPA: Tn3 family transposase [Pseudonocardiaceae bacterium]|nr:Tn3 family transposase [Pseudonocardiaceae bacterium]
MATQFFSASEIGELESWPSEVGRDELVQYFQLAVEDVEWVHRTTRGAPNKLGLGLQLAALPWLGFVPADVRAAPPPAVARVATQLGVEPGALAHYGRREQTRSDHLRLVAQRLGWHTAEDDDRAGWKNLREFLVDRAIEHDVPSVLFRLATEHLASRDVRIVRPGVVSLMEEIAPAREVAEREVFARIEPLLTERRLTDMSSVLEVAPEMPVSRLTWLHRGATSYSPSAIRAEVDKVLFLRGLDVDTLDLSLIPEARRRRLAGLGRRLRNQALRGRRAESKYPILLSTVVECYVEVLDELVQMFDQALSGIENRAKAKVKEKLAARGRESVNKLELLEEILAIAADTAIPANQVGGLLRERVGLERMRSARRNPKDRPYQDHGHLDTVEDSFTYLRQFAPLVIRHLEFAGSLDAQPLLAAVEILRGLYAKGTRHVPATAPASFVPLRWRGYLDRARAEADPVRYRHFWELCTLLGLRDGLRAGDVWVPGSRRYANPVAFLMPAEKWAVSKVEYCALVGAAPSAEYALAEAEEQLETALLAVEPLLAAGEGPVRLSEQGQLSINRLTAEQLPDQVEAVKLGLVELPPRIPITELLIEVDRWTGFSDRLVHASGKTARDNRLRQQLYAAILAQACNFGTTAMAEACGLTYDILAWTGQWYLREETLREANAAVVNHHHTLPMAQAWGGGTMSSSDGQRFPMKGKSLTARTLSRYFVDEGISTYTHVSDQHSTYGTKIIPVSDREAVYVLDEILGNATTLPISEHAADTAGQTLTVFSLFKLTGLVLSPRIRDLGGITLHRLGSKRDLLGRFPNAGQLLTGTIDTKLIGEQWNEMLRVAASLKYGHATASLVVGKLHAASRRSAVAQALVEYGAIQRTLYSLRYLADEAYRRRITRQLNKGESLHSLRRDLFFAHEGSVRRRHLDQQTDQALCLSLVVNAIITWNTVYLELALAEYVRAHGPVAPEVLAHLSPALMEHVNQYGTYTFPIEKVLARRGFRPLRAPDAMIPVLD